MILSVVNNNGGVGKSTLVVHAACWLARQGARVAVVDADPQGGAAGWLARCAPRIPVRRYTTADELLLLVPHLAGLHDAVVLDGPASEGAATAALVGVADVVLLPTGPSQWDIWASLPAARVVHRALLDRGEGRPPRAWAVLNRMQARGPLIPLATTAARKLGFPVSRSILQLRQAYRDAAGAGRTVWQLGPRGHAAGFELAALLTEVTSEPYRLGAGTLDAAMVAPIGAGPPTAAAIR